MTLLLARPDRRLFTVDGSAISSDELNLRLAELTGAHLTAKDFRTWHGTMTAFDHLRAHLPAGEDESQVLAAVDAAAVVLQNTRTVARAHYVHPDLLDGYRAGDLARFLDAHRARRTRWLAADERLLLGYLTARLEQRAAAAGGITA